MTRERFQDHRFHGKAAELVKRSNEIVGEYQAAGLRLTLRQIYYQLVSRNLIKNTEKEYKRLSHVLSDARRSGLVDWSAIEDRTRRPSMPTEFENPQELIEAALSSYRLPRWKGQAHYVELWVEKDALTGVLSPLAHEYHVTLQVNRGYSSDSAMYDAAGRFAEAGQAGKQCALLYLGDLDPSGEDMVRDVGDRLNLFGAAVDVRKLALTPEQVREHNPPPNPAKRSDTRAARFIEEHGKQSYEVDALRPDLLARIIREALDEIRDPKALRRIVEREKRDKSKLRRMVNGKARRAKARGRRGK